MIKAIDLFAGCGGFSSGFEKANYKIVKAVEYDKMIAKSYMHNHKNVLMISEDIRNIDNEANFKLNEADVIIGGPPCQGFSMAGARIRNNFIDDPRNYLFKHYFNVVRIVRPKIFILENVKGILTINKGEIIKKIKSMFEDPNNFDGMAYNIQYKIIKAKDYGIPQNRERVIIIGSLISFDLEKELIKTKSELLKTSNYFFENVTVWDAISNLITPTYDGVIKKLKPETSYQNELQSKNGNVYNHIKTQHNQKVLERIKKIKINENYEILDEPIKSIHSGSYGRLDPMGIAPTITTRFDTPSGGKFIHPYEDRTLTLREAARIQSFSDNFVFVGNKSNICKQIGNAVPPKLAYFFAIMIRRILNENS